MSVLALAHNHERFVEQSLDAIAAQTSTDYELIIVDDCSTDSTPALIRAWLDRTGFTAKFIRNEHNLGVSASRNVGRAIARGRYICTAATDDLYEPTRLVEQVACFATQPPEVGLVFGDLLVIDEEGQPLPPTEQRWLDDDPPSGDVFADLIRGNFIPSPATMMRRSVVDELGGWDEHLILDDWDLFVRLADSYKVHHCPGVAARYRQLDTGLSRDPGRVVERSTSVVRLMSKWTDRDPETRAYALDRAWRSALVVLENDRDTGMALLRDIYDKDPKWQRRIELELASTPAGPVLVRGARSLRELIGARAGPRHG